jgi:hypothetical protein
MRYTSGAISSILYITGNLKVKRKGICNLPTLFFISF